jgi:hypothetical protein
VPFTSEERSVVEREVTDFCERRVPWHLRRNFRIKVEVSGQVVTFWESSPSFTRREIWIDIPAARIRFRRPKRLWTLYWPDRHRRWHRYRDLRPVTTLKAALAELEHDPYQVFWLGHFDGNRHVSKNPPPKGTTIVHDLRR